MRRAELIVDPVPLGNEGLRWNAQQPRRSAGVVVRQNGANIRLVLPLTGPLAIPGLREDRSAVLQKRAAMPAVNRRGP
ncbi:MAG: hypothetical protein IPK26_13605 [Planctomycetes bacterium]|nr:hypothetical protein [Planctomycetota bacterium]